MSKNQVHGVISYQQHSLKKKMIHEVEVTFGDIDTVNDKQLIEWLKQRKITELDMDPRREYCDIQHFIIQLMVEGEDGELLPISEHDASFEAKQFAPQKYTAGRMFYCLPIEA